MQRVNNLSKYFKRAFKILHMRRGLDKSRNDWNRSYRCPPKMSNNRQNYCPVPKYCHTRRVDSDVSDGESSVFNHPDLLYVAEYVKNKLYFGTLEHGRREPRSAPDITFFSIDNVLVYNNFYNDFGPLNLGCLYKYCCHLNQKLKNPANSCKQVVHYTSLNPHKRANATFLIASYAILYLKKTPHEAFIPLSGRDFPPLKPFQDASMGTSMYHIRLIDCLNALHKAAAFGFFNFEDFDVDEFERFGHIQNGDLNWMVPQKFLAFLGPSSEYGSLHHPPERYLDYFIKNGVAAVVRLNRKSYEAARFTRAGIHHYEMFMPDGSVPPTKVLNEFLRLAETTKGPIAVHCKAGLGRTGSLIAAYLVKHYRMSAKEAIAWLRICRPGSVIGHQQAWLEEMQDFLWRSGKQYRQRYHGDGDMIIHHKRGIYSIGDKLERHKGHQNQMVPIRTVKMTCKENSSMHRRNQSPIVSNVHCSPCEFQYGYPIQKTKHIKEKTQGDKLNEIKLKKQGLMNLTHSPKKTSCSAPENAMKMHQRK